MIRRIPSDLTPGLLHSVTVLMASRIQTLRIFRVRCSSFINAATVHADITIDYKATVEWIKGQIESDVKYQTDDTRFWVGPTA